MFIYGAENSGWLVKGLLCSCIVLFKLDEEVANGPPTLLDCCCDRSFEIDREIIVWLPTLPEKR